MYMKLEELGLEENQESDAMNSDIKKNNKIGCNI